MKILHIIDSGGVYGAEIMLLNLMKEQVRLQHEPILASIGTTDEDEKPLETEALKRGFTVKKFRMVSGPNIAGAFNIIRYASSEGADILHAHGYKSNILMGFLPRIIRRLPVVSTLHGWTNTGKFNKMLLYEWADKLSLCFIDRVVAVNSSMRDKVRLKNLNVVNNGIPISDSESLVEENVSGRIDNDIIKFCEQGFTFGAVGRLSPEKGYENLLEALKIVLEKYPEVQLVIIGDGPLNGSLIERAKQLGVSGKVMFTGYRDNASRYLPCFKGFVLSSTTEGLPMVILEAMDARVPIVATKVGGVPEVLENGDAGILLDNCDSSAIAQGMIKLIENPELRLQIVETAWESVRNNYSSRLMAEKYQEIYRELLAGRPV